MYSNQKIWKFVEIVDSKYKRQKQARGKRERERRTESLKKRSMRQASDNLRNFIQISATIITTNTPNLKFFKIT